jgi:hypothetical protein
MTLGSGDERIEPDYFGPAYTDGEAWVVFPAQRVEMSHLRPLRPDVEIIWNETK